MVVDHGNVDFFVVVHTVELPFVGGIGVFQIGNRAIGGYGEHVVRGVGRTQRAQIGRVFAGVAAGAEQCGQCAARAGAVADDFARVARHFGVVGFEVAHGGFQIDNGGGCAPVGFGAAARAGAGDHIALRQGHGDGVGLAAAARIGFRLPRFARHVAAHVVGEENRRGVFGEAVDAAALEIGFGDVHVHDLIARVGRLHHVNNVLEGAVWHALPVHGDGVQAACNLGKVEVLRCWIARQLGLLRRRGLGGQGGGQQQGGDALKFHRVS